MKQLLVVLALVFAGCLPASATTCNKYAPIFIASGSDTPITLSGVSGKLTRICSINLFSPGNGAVSFLVVESGTTGCGCSGSICTGAAGVIGGATNAGQGISAPVPFSLGTGNANAIASAAMTGNNVCIYTQASSPQVQGVVVYTNETP